MPSGARPGERRGVRGKGTRNKSTELREAARQASIADPGITPLDFLLAVMRDPNYDCHTRIEAAKAALPYVHARRPQAEPKPDDPDFVPLVERLKYYERRDAIGESEGKVVELKRPEQ